MTDECDRARHAERVERVQQVRCVVLEHGRRAGRCLGPVGVRALDIGTCGIRTCGGSRVLDIKALGVKVPGAKSLVGGTFDDDDAMGGRQALRDRRQSHTNDAMPGEQASAGPSPASRTRVARPATLIIGKRAGKRLSRGGRGRIGRPAVARPGESMRPASWRRTTSARRRVRDGGSRRDRRPLRRRGRGAAPATRCAGGRRTARR